MADTKVKRKGFRDFLADDSSLKVMVDLDEFENKKIAPGNSDDKVSEVYSNYINIIQQLETAGEN